MFLPDQLHDRPNALRRDRRIDADVVRADLQHDDLRRGTVELAVRKAPEHVLRAVAAAGETRRALGAEILPPKILVRLPTVDDRCTNLLVPCSLSATHIAFGSIRM
jgi:hypothetical protein